MKMIKDIQNLMISNKIFMILGLTFFVGLILITYKQDDIARNELSKETVAEIEDSKDVRKSDIETELKNILEKVEGVGDVDVFISYKNKDDGLKHSTIFSKENDDNNYSSSEIISAIIVARGGGKAEIVSMIRNSISEALDIPLHKVIVLKMDE